MQRISLRVKITGLFIVVLAGFVASPAVWADGFATRILNSDSAKFPLISVLIKVFTSKPTTLLTDNFKVSEDNADVASFSIHAEKPVQYVVLAIDRSSSIEAQMPEVKQAAAYFIKTMPTRVKAGIMSFASDVEVNHKCSDNRQSLMQAIAKIRPYGGTSLYDVICDGCELLAQTGKRTDLKTLVVLTDGKDSNPRGTGPMSIKTLPEAIESAKKSRINVYTIGLGTDIDRSILSQIAAQSGGASLQANDTRQLQVIYQKLSERLELEQYISLVYATPNDKRDGSVRNIMINSEWQGITSQGSGTYRAPSPEPVAEPVRQDEEPPRYDFEAYNLDADIIKEELIGPGIYKGLPQPEIHDAMKTLVDSANTQLKVLYSTGNGHLKEILASWNQHIADEEVEKLQPLKEQAKAVIKQMRDGIVDILDQVKTGGNSIVDVIDDSTRHFIAREEVNRTMFIMRESINRRSFILGENLSRNSFLNRYEKERTEYLNKSHKEQTERMKKYKD
jgi:VWFA-related protein